MQMPNGSLPPITVSEFLKWLLRRRKRFRVTGASMFPILKPGDEVLLELRAFRRRKPRIGEIVVARHPRQADLRIIKRIASINPDGTFNLQGENPFESSDFRSVPPSTIMGRVTCIFHQGEPRPAERPRKE